MELKSGYALPYDKDVGAVIVGFDRNINYYKIQYAQVTNYPPTYLTPTCLLRPYPLTYMHMHMHM